MSLQDARMPSLRDKIEEEAAKAEVVFEKEEKKEEKLMKIIKKSAKKN